MSQEENKSNSSNGADSTYDKAKEYWKTVEPTVCGMLGGLPEVGFLGKSSNLSFRVFVAMEIYLF